MRVPHEFHRAMAEGGRLDITTPEDPGGAGLGVTGAAVMMRAVTSGGGGCSAASTIHTDPFGPHAVVMHGTPEQKRRWPTPPISGEQKACFGVTEPDATNIRTFAGPVEGGHRVNGRKMWSQSNRRPSPSACSNCRNRVEESGDARAVFR